jgi:uncharacterized caspase-like protein
VTSVGFTPDPNVILTGSWDETTQIWNLSTLREINALKDLPVNSTYLSRDGKSVLVGGFKGMAILWDWLPGKELRRFEYADKQSVIDAVAISPDGRTILTSISGESKIREWDSSSGKPLLEFQVEGMRSISGLTFLPDSNSLVVGDMDLDPRLVELGTGKTITTLHLPASGGCRSIAVSAKGDALLVGGFSGQVTLFDLGTGDVLRELKGHGVAADVSAVAFSPNGELIMTASFDGTTRMWNRSTGDLLATLASARGEGFTVVRPDSRFDTSALDGGAPLHWIFKDQQTKAYPPEIFMRDYYEPRLLPRLLACNKELDKHADACNKEFKPVRPLARLNRVQPLVEVKAVWKDAATGLAEVKVTVRSKKDASMKNSKTFTKPYDVRLFRDGQLVGWAPKTSVDWQLLPPPSGPDVKKNEDLDLERWREKTEVRDLKSDGSKELSFSVQVPRRADLKEVLFTAYAFNEDRVKSATASDTLPVKTPLQTRQGKAYLISVGVNQTESQGNWELHYAANDARSMSQVVGDKLGSTKQFTNIVRIRLVSDSQSQPGESAATKAHLQSVLDVLAGRRQVDDALKREIPGIEGAEKAQPEDLVLLEFSSHGYTDARGVFHMVLWDIGKNTPQNWISPALQSNSLSSDVLSGWLREVDAGELVMIVDSCQSEASVAAEGFKPGPMGSRGLGQLAYDKGMRILAASKSKDSAVERAGINHGLLTYALVDEGLGKDLLADFQPKDGKILMAEWLAYGEQEVPKLFQEGDIKGVIQIKGGPDTAKEIYHGDHKTPPRYQQPVLFDFNKSQQQTAIVTP